MSVTIEQRAEAPDDRSFEEAMTEVGVPDAQEQEAFYELMMEVRELQSRVESFRPFCESNAQEALEGWTAACRVKVETVVRLARHLHSFRAPGEPSPYIVRLAIAKAEKALRGFTYWGMPLRVIH